MYLPTLTVSVLAAMSAGAQTPASQLPQPGWRVPIHAAANDPDPDAKGLWAAGDSYKVRLDEGCTFFPVLGPQAPRNMPLRWRTERVTVGGRECVDLDRPADRRFSDWRYELHRGDLIEAYDVLPEGVEQTFVLRTPVGTGDLVIRGRLESQLHTAPVNSAQQDLVFTDEHGVAVIRYGRALAFDATDRRVPVDTSFDGAVVSLRLSADFLADATYPITVDPLIATAQLIPGSTTSGSPSLARNDGGNEYCLTFSRAVSMSDTDAYAWRVDNNFGAVAPIFTDITASRSTPPPAVAWVGGAQRWVLAANFISATSARVALYFHDDDAPLNSGHQVILGALAGVHDQTPQLGGSTTGTDAYLVFRRDLGAAPINGNGSRVLGRWIDALNRSWGAPVLLHDDAAVVNYDAEALRSRPRRPPVRGGPSSGKSSTTTVPATIGTSSRSSSPATATSRGALSWGRTRSAIVTSCSRRWRVVLDASWFRSPCATTPVPFHGPRATRSQPSGWTGTRVNSR